MDLRPEGIHEPKVFLKDVGGLDFPAVNDTGSAVVPTVLKENPEVVYRFLTSRPYYEQLCQEIAYVLKKRLAKLGIEISSITYRTKDLNSFLEKLERKNCNDPFKEIKDFAGVRVVCLYPSDLEKIEHVIYNEFEVEEKIDKYGENKDDRFGYMAVHFLVKLGDEFSGVRYDHLKTLSCEIQTRTILQHAWALIDHHLVYKKKSTVPENIRHEISQLSKVLEDADRRFEKLRKKRAEYIKTLEETKSDDRFLEMEINADSFKAFCERAFPEAKPEATIRNYYLVLKWIDPDRYSNIRKLLEMVRKASPVLDWLINEINHSEEVMGREEEYWSNLRLVHISLTAADPEYRKTANLSRYFMEILEKMDKNKILERVGIAGG